MSRKIQLIAVCLVLAFSMLISLAACDGGQNTTGTVTGTAEPATTGTAPSSGPRKNLVGVYLIGSADEVKYLREFPTERFIVDGDIDLGGAVWEPIPEFSGKITGTWGGIFNHTISNFVIEASADDQAVGFFGKMTGTVTDLNLSDFTVKVNGLSGAEVGGFAGSVGARTVTDVDVKNVTIEVEGKDLTVGAFCGSSKGSLTECFVSGSVTVSSSGNTVVGGMVGSAGAQLKTDESRADLVVTASGDSLLAGGIAGNYDTSASLEDVDYGGNITVNSTAASSFAAPLCGTAHAKIQSCYSSARSFKVTGAKSANAYVGDMQTGAALDDCWVRDVSNLDETTLSPEEYALRRTVVDYMEKEVTIPWKPRVDMSYSDTCSSGHNQKYSKENTYFGLPYVHTCGSLERMQAYIGEDGVLIDAVPKTGWETWLGNDCADCVYWALARVSNTVCYRLTNDMYTEAGGTLPVGPYKRTSTTSTRDICSDNGEKVMYESYAAVKMGDAFCFADPNGHARMAIEAAYVYRNADGSINPEKSYILMDEQGATVGDEGKTHTTCLWHGKYTFKNLFSKAWVPLTVKEYAEGKAPEFEVSLDKEATGDNLYDLTITSNYRINWVRGVVTDASGSVVAERTFYPCTGQHNVTFETTRFRTYFRDVKAAGTYTCKYIVGAGNGLEKEAATITFTK